MRRTAIKETVGHALGDLEMHDSENGIQNWGKGAAVESPPPPPTL